MDADEADLQTFLLSKYTQELVDAKILLFKSVCQQLNIKHSRELAKSYKNFSELSRDVDPALTNDISDFLTWKRENIKRKREQEVAEEEARTVKQRQDAENAVPGILRDISYAGNYSDDREYLITNEQLLELADIKISSANGLASCLPEWMYPIFQPAEVPYPLRCWGFPLHFQRRKLTLGDELLQRLDIVDLASSNMHFVNRQDLIAKLQQIYCANIVQRHHTKPVIPVSEHQSGSGKTRLIREYMRYIRNLDVDSNETENVGKALNCLKSDFYVHVSLDIPLPSGVSFVADSEENYTLVLSQIKLKLMENFFETDRRLARTIEGLDLCNVIMALKHDMLIHFDNVDKVHGQTITRICHEIGHLESVRIYIAGKLDYHHPPDYLPKVEFERFALNMIRPIHFDEIIRKTVVNSNEIPLRTIAEMLPADLKESEFRQLVWTKTNGHPKRLLNALKFIVSILPCSSNDLMTMLTDWYEPFPPISLARFGNNVEQPLRNIIQKIINSERINLAQTVNTGVSTYLSFKYPMESLVSEIQFVWEGTRQSAVLFAPPDLIAKIQHEFSNVENFIINLAFAIKFHQNINYAEAFEVLLKHRLMDAFKTSRTFSEEFGSFFNESSLANVHVALSDQSEIVIPKITDKKVQPPVREHGTNIIERETLNCGSAKVLTASLIEEGKNLIIMTRPQSNSFDVAILAMMRTLEALPEFHLSSWAAKNYSTTEVTRRIVMDEIMKCGRFSSSILKNHVLIMFATKYASHFKLVDEEYSKVIDQSSTEFPDIASELRKNRISEAVLLNLQSHSRLMEFLKLHHAYSDIIKKIITKPSPHIQMG